MGTQGITKIPAEQTMGMFQLGVVKVARQWKQEKTEGYYKGRYREDNMKIKRNFFSPPPM